MGYEPTDSDDEYVLGEFAPVEEPDINIDRFREAFAKARRKRVAEKCDEENKDKPSGSES